MTKLNFCRVCGLQLANNAAVCTRCVGGAARPAPSPENERLQRWILPVGRSPYAIAAGYLGLFSVLLVPAPLALITGFLAIRDMKRNPTRHGMGRAIFGIVMGGFGTLALLAALAA